MKVFVVEDSAAVRERLCAMIADVDGAEVVATADGEETALNGIAETMPDLVMLDLHLASGSGMAVLRQVKALQPRVKVIVLTSVDYPRYQQKLMSAGADHYLVKSRDISTLPALLAEMAAKLSRDQTEKGSQ